MRYGYKSMWAGAMAIEHNTSQVAHRFLLALSRERREHPSRPLIIIAHCFGGLVVLKSEMLQAALSQYDETEVHASKMGILDPGNELLRDLVDNSGQIRSQSNRAEVACFFELEPSDVKALVGAQRRMVRATSHTVSNNAQGSSTCLMIFTQY
ncbi:hypothetical protein D6C98_10652 [Aureobasidium pullulans]|nr:hypothetical protein D6C98_10652 [Aureobasidium pullulans]